MPTSYTVPTVSTSGYAKASSSTTSIVCVSAVDGTDSLLYRISSTVYDDESDSVYGTAYDVPVPVTRPDVNSSMPDAAPNRRTW